MANTEGSRLHSAYNPCREAERYVESVLLDKSPRIIVITEPGESYLAKEFRSRLPHAQLLVLRYTKNEFRDTDSLWDAVWRPGSMQSASEFLFSSIPEEFLPSTIFVPWKPSDSRWPEISKTIWNKIATHIKIQSAVFRTRSHFGKRWLANSVNNCVFAQNPIILPKISQPTLLACAGPSLEKIFPFNTNLFFITAVSSALSCLSFHGVVPDICITTDGGYWSREHFRNCSPSIPVVFPLEAAIPSGILEKNPVGFLSYGTHLEDSLYRITRITPVSAERNGTVAGTAARYLLDTSTKQVIAAGLDLSVEKSFTHVRPHAFNPILDSMTDRMAPLCGVLYDRSGNKIALDAYAHWFSTREAAFTKRFFRIPESSRLIPEIPSKSLSHFLDADTNKQSEKKSVVLHKQCVSSVADRAYTVASFLEETAHCISDYTTNIDDNALVLEIVQLVSFTGYVSHLTTGNAGTWREETSDFLCSLAKKVLIHV